MSDESMFELSPMFKMPVPNLSISKKEKTKLKKNGFCEVTFPVSYRYNGGIILSSDGTPDWNCKNPDSKHYAGYEVPDPIVPEGYHLVSLGIGLQLNARPPYATVGLKKND